MYKNRHTQAVTAFSDHHQKLDTLRTFSDEGKEELGDDYMENDRAWAGLQRPRKATQRQREKPFYLSEFHVLVSERGPKTLASSQNLWENKMREGHECLPYLFHVEGYSEDVISTIADKPNVQMQGMVTGAVDPLWMRLLWSGTRTHLRGAAAV